MYIEDEVFRIKVQVTKVRGLKTLSMQKPHVVWVLDKKDIDKFSNMGVSRGVIISILEWNYTWKMKFLGFMSS